MGQPVYSATQEILTVWTHNNTGNLIHCFAYQSILSPSVHPFLHPLFGKENV